MEQEPCHKDRPRRTRSVAHVSVASPWKPERNILQRCRAFDRVRRFCLTRRVCSRSGTVGAMPNSQEVQGYRRGIGAGFEAADAFEDETSTIKQRGLVWAPEFLDFRTGRMSNDLFAGRSDFTHRLIARRGHPQGVAGLTAVPARILKAIESLL